MLLVQIVDILDMAFDDRIGLVGIDEPFQHADGHGNNGMDGEHGCEAHPRLRGASHASRTSTRSNRLADSELTDGI